MPKKKKQENIVRLAETNLDATRPVADALRSIKGVGFNLARSIAKETGLRGKKLGDLTEKQQKDLEKTVKGLSDSSIPEWMLNRRKDIETGEDRHLVASDLELTQRMDINRMKKLKTYRGIRHSRGLPVRGQRTRSSFRKGKIVGVKRKETKIREAKAESKK